MYEHDEKQCSFDKIKYEIYENDDTSQICIEGKNDVNLLNYILSQLTKNNSQKTK